MMHTESSYRKHWAALTGRSESEVYVPAALRERLEPQSPKAGDRIRILELDTATKAVKVGDVLTVIAVYAGGNFHTDAPRLTTPGLEWNFGLGDEGTGWERVR